jgi:hypothetical protein
MGGGGVLRSGMKCSCQDAVKEQRRPWRLHWRQGSHVEVRSEAGGMKSVDEVEKDKNTDVDLEV